MKKFLIIILSIFLIPMGVFASTNTLTRTEEEPLLPRDVRVTPDILKDVLKIPAVEAREKVYDFANILTISEENDLYDQVKQFIRDSGIDIVIVTVDDLKGLELDSYIPAFYNYNDFYDSGIYFFFYKDKESKSVEASIELMGDANKIFTRDDLRTIRRTCDEEVDEKEYYTAVSTSIDSFVELFNDYLKVSEPVPWLAIGIISFSITFLIVLFFVSRLNSKNILRYKDNLNQKIDEDTLVINQEMDDYLGVIVSKN